MKRSVALTVIAAILANSSVPALANTPIITINSERELSEEEQAQYELEQQEWCRNLAKNRSQAMKSVRNGKLDTQSLISLSQDYREEGNGCIKDVKFSFDLLKEAVGFPIPLSTDPELIFEMERRLGELVGHISSEQAQGIREKAWLLSGSQKSYVGPYWRDASKQVAMPFDDDNAAAVFFSKPENLAMALDHFGTKLSRDHALLRLISDPKRGLFDRVLFARLAQIESSRTYPRNPRPLLKAARLMMNTQYGEPDAEAARQLLVKGRFTPYIHRLGLEEAEEDARDLLQEIAGILVQSSDTENQKMGQSILATGDPMAPEYQTPDNYPENPFVLEQWPKILPSPDWTRSALRVANSYPSRAIRREHAGPVETALHYDANGEFVGVILTRSSGSDILDEGAVKSWTRYHRPKPPLTLPTGGRDVLISLPTVEYHFSEYSAHLPKIGLKTNPITGEVRVIAAAEARRPDSNRTTTY